MNKNLTNIASLFAGAFVLSSAAKSYAAEYQVTIQTAALASSALSANGPFSLDFAITYGGQSAGNTATINNFSFGGGSATGSAILTGNAAGSLSSAVTLSDSSSSFYNDLNQTFNPGSTVSFDVTLSDNPSAQTPDELAIAILDNGGAQIVTTDPAQLSLATFEIRNFGTIQTAAYAGIDNTDSNNANEAELGDYSGVTASVSVAPVPEPSSDGIIALGLAVGGLFLVHRKISRV